MEIPHSSERYPEVYIDEAERNDLCLRVHGLLSQYGRPEGENPSTVTAAFVASAPEDTTKDEQEFFGPLQITCERYVDPDEGEMFHVSVSQSYTVAEREHFLTKRSHYEVVSNLSYDEYDENWVLFKANGSRAFNSRALMDHEIIHGWTAEDQISFQREVAGLEDEYLGRGITTDQYQELMDILEGLSEDDVVSPPDAA